VDKVSFTWHWFMAGVLPYLKPEELAPLWGLSWWGKCEITAEQMVARGVRLALYRAVAARDLPAMMQRGEEYLKIAGEVAGRNEQDYALSVALAAAVASGEQATARRLWDTYGAIVFPQGQYSNQILLLLGQIHPG
jgi:hypothetical protein